MTRTDEYTANVQLLYQATGKVILNQKEAAAALGVTPVTLRKHYGEYFEKGKITTARLAEILTRRSK